MGPDLASETQDAWAAYKALQDAARRDPALFDNPFFIAAQDGAYARFRTRFGQWDGKE